MSIAMDEVLKQNKFCEATICYTGDIMDKSRTRYTLDYYVKLAKELEKKMRQAAVELNFEQAAKLRDRMLEVKKKCFRISNKLTKCTSFVMKY